MWRTGKKKKKGGGMRMLLQKIWISFLCKRASMWTHTKPQGGKNTQICRVKRMLTHIPARLLSLSPFPCEQNPSHTHTRTQRKKVWLGSFALWQDTPSPSRGEERDTAAPISCPKPSLLANKKRDLPILFHCGRTTRLS